MVSENQTTLDGIRDIKICQNSNGYRFSVDALLLYSFVKVKHASRIADLGAGSGIIGLLLARKYVNATVTLVELQKSLFCLAEKNILINGLEERVRAVCADIKSMKTTESLLPYDLIVSNPPFRTSTSGLLSVGEEKAVARHELKLRFSDLAEAASHLLKPRGRFSLIFHPERLPEIFEKMRSRRLEPKRIRFVHNDSGAVSKIVLIEAVKDGRMGLKVEKPLFLYREDGTYTPELDEMYRGGIEDKELIIPEV
jgi:tRNA1Val (adenine37-N6)-methyltransferase